MTVIDGSSRRLVMLSMLSACGLILFIFESFLPVLPWFRPGLGNIATILALLLFGFSDAVKVTLLRIILGALILGRLFTPVFLLALGGGLASTITMALTYYSGRKAFGPVGVSVAGAAAHNVTQLFLAYLFFVKSVEVFIITPIFMFAGIITGILTGLIAAMVLERARKSLADSAL